MINIIKDSDNPKILVITPLLPEHSISKETKLSIKSNKIDYKWISYSDNRKHADNVQAGLDEYKKQYGFIPEYFFILDNDIKCGRKMLDRLYKHFLIQPDNIAYVYCSFEYRGYKNFKFPPIKYNIEKLRRANYISSNSLYKTDIIEKIGGLITDLDRLADWALWLKLYNNGYIGSLCYDTSFVAMSTKNDISAGSNEEFYKIKKIIQERYIKLSI